MTLYVDGQYVFRELLSSARREQMKEFHTEKHVGNYIPVNSYVLVFDAIVRVISLYDTLIEALKKKYKIKQVVFIKRKLVPIGLYYYDRYAKKNSWMKDYIYSLAKVINKYKVYNETEPNELVGFMEKKFNIKDWHLKMMGDGKYNMVPVLLFYVAVYQNYITLEIQNYIYNLLALSSNNDVVSSASRKMKNCYILAGKKTRNQNVVIKVDLKAEGKINIDEAEDDIEEMKRSEIAEKRKFKKLCDDEYSHVLNVNDDNVILALSGTKDAMKTCEYPRSFAYSNYSNFKPIFEKILSKNKLSVEGFI